VLPVLSIYIGRISAACDIYAFGVVTLEILTSRKAYDDTLDPPSVVHAFEEAEEDRSMSGFLDSRVEVGWTEETASGLARLAKGCLQGRSVRRPATAAVSATLLAECEKYPLLPPPPVAPSAAEGGGGEESPCCVVCMVAPRSHVFIPCGHQCVCGECSTEMLRRGRGARVLCPVCRRASTSVMQIYE
jgi:hypothetical protein